jgi:hypothetical protein
VWPRRFHKLGGGKPLGFGSVTIQVMSSDVRLGTAWRSYFALAADLTEGDLDEATVDTLVSGAVPAQDKHIVAYEAYLRGFPKGTPVHYPADPANQQSDEDRYQWFVENRRDNVGLDLVLGELTSDYNGLRLPTNPTRGPR